MHLWGRLLCGGFRAAASFVSWYGSNVFIHSSWSTSIRTPTPPCTLISQDADNSWIKCKHHPLVPSEQALQAQLSARAAQESLFLSCPSGEKTPLSAQGLLPQLPVFLQRPWCYTPPSGQLLVRPLPTVLQPCPRGRSIPPVSWIHSPHQHLQLFMDHLL